MMLHSVCIAVAAIENEKKGWIVRTRTRSPVGRILILEQHFTH